MKKRQLYTSTQIGYVLAYLQRNESATTFDFRKQSISQPAKVIWDLVNKYGYNIVKKSVTVYDELGNIHRNVAEYRLIENDQKGGVNG